MKLAAFFCCVMIATVFTACDKENNPSNPNNSGNSGNSGTPAGKETKPTTVDMTYLMKVGADMPKYLDISAEYYDANGKIQKAQITKDSLKVTFKAKLPAKLGFSMSVKMKTGADPSKVDSIHVKYSYSYEGVLRDAKGEWVKTTSNGLGPRLDFPNTTFSRWVTEKGENLAGYLLEYDADGNFTESKWK